MCVCVLGEDKKLWDVFLYCTSQGHRRALMVWCSLEYQIFPRPYRTKGKITLLYRCNFGRSTARFGMNHWFNARHPWPSDPDVVNHDGSVRNGEAKLFQISLQKKDKEREKNGRIVRQVLRGIIPPAASIHRGYHMFTLAPMQMHLSCPHLWVNAERKSPARQDCELPG